MFSSRFFWTAALGYLLLAAAAAWFFGGLPQLGSDPTAGSHSGGTAVWAAVLLVATLGLFLTWGVLHRAAVRLAGITESAAARELGEPLWTTPPASRGTARNLESAIDSMNRQLETRIEELQRKSRQLQESTERLETVLGSMVEGVVAVDENQRILFANRAARICSTCRPAPRSVALSSKSFGTRGSTK